MEAAAKVIPLYRSACTLFTMAQPNAGQPVLQNMKAVYKQTPEAMSAMLPALLQAGTNVVGSCCGSTPDHTRAIRAGINTYQNEL